MRELDEAYGPPFFTLPQTRSMARIVFTYAWHLARSQKRRPACCSACLRIAHGSSPCARLRQIHDLAEAHPEWLQPRWATRPQFWRELLLECDFG